MECTLVPYRRSRCRLPTRQVAHIERRLSLRSERRDREQQRDLEPSSHRIRFGFPTGSARANRSVDQPLGQVGASDWFILPVRGNRIFTVVTQALDETGAPSATKAMPALGVWDGFLPVGSAAPGFTIAANGSALGETWLQWQRPKRHRAPGYCRPAWDGRPDYLYRGWVLYADTVSPTRLPASGGQIVIRGTGFHQGDTVQVGGVAATVTSILPTEITAIVAPSAASTAP